MENFLFMFPDLSPKQIENVLRKNEGDVENSINDLLKLGKDGGDIQPSGRGSSHTAPSCSTSTAPSYSHRKSFDQPNCDDDEKIALMLQNREFLRYLRSNPNFMRELNADSNDYYSASRRHESVLSRCKRREYGGWTTHEPPPINPEDYEKVSLPDGPLVDPCEKPLSRLSKKIKSKLPSTEGSGVPKPEDMYPHTVIVDYESGDDRFVQKLKNMSRNSKSMVLNLARNFNFSKKPSALMPNDYSEQSKDFSYDLHQNPSKFS